MTKIIGAFGGAMAGGFNVRDATRVGYGMVSRGEVALVAGLQHGLLGNEEFSATILMTLATTLVAPLLLKWAYREERRQPVFSPAPVAAGGLMLAESAEA